MSKRFRKISLLLLGMLFLLALLILLVYVKNEKPKSNTLLKTQPQTQEDRFHEAVSEKTMPIGDVNLNPSMDYGKLKSLLQDKGQSDRRPGKLPLYENAVTIEWNAGVSAMFFATSEFPADTQEPVSLYTNSVGRFQGSICGAHLGDSVEKASVAVRQCGCRIGKANKYGSIYAQLSVDCRSQKMLVNLVNEKIDSIEIKDKGYVSLPSAR